MRLPGVAAFSERVLFKIQEVALWPLIKRSRVFCLRSQDRLLFYCIGVPEPDVSLGLDHRDAWLCSRVQRCRRDVCRPHLVESIVKRRVVHRRLPLVRAAVRFRLELLLDLRLVIQPAERTLEPFWK